MPKSYDIVGRIAVIRPPSRGEKNRLFIAQEITRIHRNVRTVLAQTGPVEGDFRLRELAHVMGDVGTSALHRESGCTFRTDVVKCYFSPRLLN